MKTALNKEKVRQIYDKTAVYYDMFHNWGTFGLDERGRNLLIKRIVKEGDRVLDAGGGTGTTAIKAGLRVGPNGHVVILDLSEGMLAVARKKIKALGIEDRFETKVGDMYQIPYPDQTFDVVMSAYSTCPLEDPMKAVKEMFRVLKNGGLLGIVHSVDSEKRIVRRISGMIENVLWKFPRLSLGCRNISLSDGIRKLNVEMIEEKIIGCIPFFFKILIVRKR